MSANRAVIPIYRNDNGSVTRTAYFANPSYLPAEYGDTDYGLVFNVDYYALHYPAVVAEVGNCPLSLLE